LPEKAVLEILGAVFERCAASGPAYLHRIAALREKGKMPYDPNERHEDPEAPVLPATFS
jgi:hypothetical protein